MRFAQALEQSKWFSLPGLHCEKVLHKRFARMEGAVFEVHFWVDPVDWVDSYLPKLHSMILRVINKNQLIGEIYSFYPFLRGVFWNILWIFVSPQKITQFFPTCWLAHNIFWTPAPGKPFFSHRFGRFLPFWGGHLDGVATTRLQLLSRKGLWLALCQWRGGAAGGLVTAFTSGLGGDGRQGEPDAPQKPRQGKPFIVVVKFVVLAGHVVTNKHKRWFVI